RPRMGPGTGPQGAPPRTKVRPSQDSQDTATAGAGWSSLRFSKLIEPFAKGVDLPNSSDLFLIIGPPFPATQPRSAGAQCGRSRTLNSTSQRCLPSRL